MPSEKHNSIMGIITALTPSLLDVASSQDVSFYQPQQLHCLHHGSTETYLCSPFCSIPFSLTMKVTICGTHVMLWLRCETRVNAELAGVLLTLFLAWNIAQHVKRARSDLKRSNTPWPSDTPTFKSINEACTLTIKHTVFSMMAGLIVEIVFVLFSVYNAA